MVTSKTIPPETGKQNKCVEEDNSKLFGVLGYWCPSDNNSTRLSLRERQAGKFGGYGGYSGDS